jgi:hypothetical protein
MQGVMHRSLHTCPEGHEFFWQPAVGICPYCSLGPEERAAGLEASEPPQPCPLSCCPA